jgi:TatD DNase family protein
MGEPVYRNEEVLQSQDCLDLIDTHCHMDLEPLYSHLEDVVSRARQMGVRRYVVPGVHPSGWERMSALSGQNRGLYPAFGIHPMHAAEADDTRLSQLEARACCGVAIGEIGLDPSYEISLERQEYAFREQLRIAVSLNMPVLVHCRRVFLRTLRILQEEHAGHVGGIMHAFSGSVEMAREFIRLGFVISVSGVITRRNAIKPLKLVRELSLEHLVLETDAPDLTPLAFQGMWNRPAYMLETLRAVAAIKEIEPLQVAVGSRSTTLRILPKLQIA